LTNYTSTGILLLYKGYNVNNKNGQKIKADISLNSVTAAQVLSDCYQHPESTLSLSRRLKLILPDFLSRVKGSNRVGWCGRRAYYD
jgi:hypothetical protein